MCLGRQPGRRLPGWRGFRNGGHFRQDKPPWPPSWAQRPALGSAGQSWRPLCPLGLWWAGTVSVPCVREVTRAHVLLPLAAPIGLSPPFHTGISHGPASTFLWRAGGEGEKGQFFLLLLTMNCPSLPPPWASLERARAHGARAGCWQHSNRSASSFLRRESWEHGLLCSHQEEP